MEARLISHPWTEMRRLQREMERLFGDVTPSWRWPLTGDYPPVNITRREEGLVIDAMCPGADRDSLEVTAIGDSVTIRGQRRSEPDLGEAQYHRRERPQGPFTRTLSLGDRLDPDRTQATYSNGMLDLRVARAAETAPKKIPIQS
jgi:HSP20 family protein